MGITEHGKLFDALILETSFNKKNNNNNQDKN